MKKEELAVTNKTESALAMQKVDLNNFKNVDLDKAEAMPIDLMSDYWTPENPGESKKVLFNKIDVRPVLSQESGEIIDLECAYFIEKDEDGNLRTITNGSKRLVGALTAYNIEEGTALLITYRGKKRNRSNQFSSDNWSVKPLVFNLPNEEK